jgi:hypothetical protein
MIKRRVAALESRLSKTAKIEDIIQAVNDELMGIEVPERKWQWIRNSPAYRLMESIAAKKIV